ncbi:peptidase S9 [beta proteobacterium AAP99]|nr:peptidase S9 [beta proteobacterium AAP99]
MAATAPRPARIGLLILGALALAACGGTGPLRGAQSDAKQAAPATPAPIVTVAQGPQLIPRYVLFGNPERAGGSISPDGKWLGFVAPRDGVLNVWVAPADKPGEARPMTNDRRRGIRSFSFAFDGKHILYAQDEGGDENFQLFAADLASGTARALTPKGSRAGLLGLSERLPGEVLVTVNDRDPKFFDVARIDIASGKRTPVLRNTEYGGFIADSQLRVRFASKPTADGGTQWFERAAAASGAIAPNAPFRPFAPMATVPGAEAMTTGPMALSTDGNTLYLRDSRNRNTAALFAMNLRTRAVTLLHEDARADFSGFITHPTTGLVQAAAATYLRDTWRVIDPAIKADIDRLDALAGDGEFGINARTRDDKTWVVNVRKSNESTKVYFYDRASGKATLWYDTRPALTGLPLQPMWPVEIKARDGLTLPSYYTLPRIADPDGDGKPNRAVPMVLMVHGGPWARDSYGFNGYHQWLANRGYAVLSVNFRGSTGFGKNFVNAGDRQWGRKMHDDLLDAVNWAAQQGIAQRDRVAILGGSYGGYAALAGVTMTPKDFACGVSIVGPSNLNTLLNSIPPYWTTLRQMFAQRVGDPDTPEGKALLAERSPLSFVDRIERPLLIGQGANDPRVKQAESDQIVKAMQARKIPVTYVLYPDEGHGFARPQNNTSFNAVTEVFLGRCLGGRVEPIGGDLEGSSITIPVGAEVLPGVKDALSALPAKR